MAESADRIVEHLRAGYSCFWIKTQEPRRAMESLQKTISSYQRKDGHSYVMGTWNCNESGTNPGKPLAALTEAKDFTVVVLQNYHWFIEKGNVVQYIQDHVEVWKSKGKAIVVLAPILKVPVELDKDFTLLDFDLPADEDISKTIDFISSHKEDINLSDEGREKLVSACKGLTQLEMENVLSRSLVEKGDFDLPIIHQQKKALIEKNGFLEIVDPMYTFEDIKGYDQIKRFVMSTINKKESKGILIMGPPGCGKTHFMNCLAGSTGMLTVALDFGKMMSKFQGESDSNMDSVIATLKAVGRCILQIDEFEKQFAGAGSSGDTDSGVTRRVTGKWLRFMQDRPDGIYIIGTCNSFRGIPPEYLRPGRWDTSPFFIDLPNTEEKADIMDFYIDKFDLDPKQQWPNMDLWTGAEIEACCSNASMMETKLTEAEVFIKPQAKTMEEEIQGLRSWAKDRTIPATSITVAPPKKRKKRKLDL